MYRALRLLGFALLCFLMASVPVMLIIFWPAISERMVPRARSPAIASAPVPQTSPAPLVALPRLPPRKGNRSWKAVDAMFEQSRAARGEHPAWKDNPSQLYEDVANPAFTDSESRFDHCVALGEWRRDVPASPTPLIALARAHIAWAWEARGYGPASTIADEDWQTFLTRIAESRRLLEQAIAMGVKDGEAHRLLILVGMGEGQPYAEVRAMLDEGRKLDPTYFPLYIQFARYLLPRWHGKRGDIERFAAEMARSLPGDDGLEAYARIAAKIHQIDTERELLFFGEYDKALLVKASEVLRERRDGNDWETNFAALCAWAAQDRTAALQLRPAIENSAENDEIWPWGQQRREFCLWCDREDLAGTTGEANWFWGSLFCGDQLVFAKDSRSVWCSGGYGPAAVKRLDVEEGRVVQSLSAPAPRADCLAVDSTKDWVLAGLAGQSVAGLILWDLAEPGDPRTFATAQQVGAVAIHPTEPVIAWATERTVHVTNVRTGAEITSFETAPRIHRLHFSADGHLLIVSSSHESIWDAETGQLKHDMPHASMRPPISDTRCPKILDIDREGRIWAIVQQTRPHRYDFGSYDADARNWEALIVDLPSFVSPPAASLSADHRLLATNTLRAGKGTLDMEIDVWNVESGQRIKHFRGHNTTIRAMSFSLDGKWLATMGFPTALVKLWALSDPSSEENSQL